MQYKKALLWMILNLAAMTGSVRADQLHVLAAGSLREVIGEIGRRYQIQTGIEVRATPATHTPPKATAARISERRCETSMASLGIPASVYLAPPP